LYKGGLSVIEFINLEKEYKSKDKTVHALKNINLKINKGEIFGIVGYSGAGKSSLLRCVNYLEPPTSGQVIVDGQDLTQLTEKQIREVKRNIGMVFQHFNLLNSKTVYANVAMPLILAKKPKERIRERVIELLEFVGLADNLNDYPDQLSGGQKQRVGIARALATQPSILLCDEATSALDPQTTSSILQLLKKINEEYKITILMITHEMSVVSEICDRVAVMESGKIIEVGTVFEVFSKPKTETARKFVSTVMNDQFPPSIKEILKEGNRSKSIYQIRFFGQQTESPLISQVAKKFNVDITILFGNVTELQGQSFGNLIIEFIGDDIEIQRAINYLNHQQIYLKEVTSHAS
jgi:D-methionine transport system ATP-binding protein